MVGARTRPDARVGAGLLAGMALLTLVLTAGASPALLLLSADGRHFAPQLPGPILQDTIVLSPGDEVTDTVWARNDGPGPGLVSVHVTGVQSSLPPEVDAPDDFWITLRPEGAEPVSSAAQQAAQCLLLGSWAVQPGEATALEFAVELLPASGDVSQRQRVSIDFEIGLQPEDADVPPCPGAAPPPPPSPPPGLPPLPPTGAPILVTAVLALMLVGLGALLLRGARRGPSGQTTD